MLMQASVKQALRRLDNVDPGVKEFFKGAAKTVAEGADPVDALAAALGCMSGFTEVPQDRSLLTQVRPGLSVSKPSPRLPFEAVSLPPRPVSLSPPPALSLPNPPSALWVAPPLAIDACISSFISMKNALDAMRLLLLTLWLGSRPCFAAEFLEKDLFWQILTQQLCSTAWVAVKPHGHLQRFHCIKDAVCTS